MSAFKWNKNNSERCTILPIVHDDIWALKKKIEACSWLATEIPEGNDRLDWGKMSEDERKYVKFSIGFFMRIDIDVLDNIESYEDKIDCLEAQFFYKEQSRQEVIHAESYALQAQAILSGAELEEVQNSIQRMPIIQKITQWVKSYKVDEIGIELYLVFMAAVEGILFSASFAGLQWLREKNVLAYITTANQLILRDENIHTQMSTLLLRKWVKKRPAFDKALEIIVSAINIMDEFITESIPVKLIGMNADLMKQYVRYRADSILLDMDYVPYFNCENPFDFMKKVLLNSVNKANFFERTATEYSHGASTDLTQIKFN